MFEPQAPELSRAAFCEATKMAYKCLPRPSFVWHQDNMTMDWNVIWEEKADDGHVPEKSLESKDSESD
jgi:hypothetical protein